MFGWLREYLDIRQEAREKRARLIEELHDKAKTCNSCEVLKVALEQAQHEKRQILDRLLSLTDKQPVEPERTVAPEPITVPPRGRHIPFAVKRQMLEDESREQARILKEHEDKLRKARESTNAAVTKERVSDSIASLESELGITSEAK